MKLSKTHIFIGISSLALLIVLVIQIHWILQTAQMKEELFNDKVHLVLSKTAESFSSNKQPYKNWSNISENEKQEIDSLLAKYMSFYHVKLDYSFDVRAIPKANAFPALTRIIQASPTDDYKMCMGDSLEGNMLELKLNFPEKHQYILAEVGIPFISSIALLLVVLLLSWRTVYSLSKEKRISENTAEFLNNMTHEFKTPLTNISLAGKMLVKDSNIHQEEKIRKFSDIILAENDKLRNQVEHVLSLSALEKGEMQLHKNKIDFHSSIEACVNTMHIQLENVSGTLEIDLSATESQVIGDVAHLKNSVCNLLDNAIKYSKEAPRISIYSYNTNRSFCLEINDEGIGIDKQYQKDVFQKFFRVPTGDVHNVKGFGMGLSYVKKIVELHGGTIELKSEMRKGTTFILTFPYV